MSEAFGATHRRKTLLLLRSRTTGSSRWLDSSSQSKKLSSQLFLPTDICIVSSCQHFKFVNVVMTDYVGGVMGM